MLGNMTVNVAFFSTAVISAAARLAPWQATLIGLAPLLAIILFGEVLPKTVALAHPAGVATLVALPLSAIHRLVTPAQRTAQRYVISPLVRLFSPDEAHAESVSRDELKALLDASAHYGTLDVSLSALLAEVVDLSAIKVRQAMIARMDIIAHEIHAPRSELLDKIRGSGLRRIPVYEKHLDNILGVLDTHEVLLQPQRPIRELLHDVVFVPEIVSLDKLLETFRQRGRKMAVAVDEYGGTAGLITLEDVVEELIGELRDPNEPQTEPVRQIGADTFILDGELSVRAWAEAFRTQLPKLQVDTVAGLITALLRRWPVVGDSVRIRNLALTVQEMRGRRITRIELLRQEQQPASAAAQEAPA
jgi:putative hemolysin